MNKEDLKEKVEELTLMLLHLTSWEENEFGIQYRRSWKGYDFDILDELTDEDLIRGGHRSKSVILTDDGMKKVKELLKKYHIEEE
ncbi:MAG: transposase [Clostridiales bacterium GWC2_40_7]|nr:MAG: transposase [Clostridiales bacterium GWC2_40_7]